MSLPGEWKGESNPDLHRCQEHPHVESRIASREIIPQPAAQGNWRAAGRALRSREPCAPINVKNDTI